MPHDNDRETVRTEEPVVPSGPAQHRTSTFEGPLPPWNTLAVAFLGGPLPGGLVVAWNFARLGMRAQRGRWLLAFVLAWLVGSGVVLSVDGPDGLPTPRPAPTPPAIASPAPDPAHPGARPQGTTIRPGQPRSFGDGLYDEVRRSGYRLTAFRRRFFRDPIRLLPRALGVLLAAWAARLQARRYAEWERSPDFTPTHYPAWKAIGIATALLTADLVASFTFAFGWVSIARLWGG